MFRCWPGCVGLLVVGISLVPALAAPPYFMTDLTLTAGLGPADAYGVNDSGLVVGHRKVGDDWKAYSLESSSGWRDLGELPNGTSSMARVVNSSGTIAGWSWTNTAGNLHGVVWMPGQQIIDLGALPGNDTSEAMDINDAGWTCGHAAAADGRNHAVVWDTDFAIYDLGCLPGDNYSYAQAIANDGLVVGYSFSSADYLGDMFTWTRAGGMVNVGRPAGAKSVVPLKINNLGQAVCKVSSTSGQTSYALWSAATGFRDSSLYGLKELYDINDAGMMLGRTLSGYQLVVRYPDGSTSILETVPGSQTIVCGMNNLGWVVGFASGTEYHALLWQPVPEPSSLLVLACGAVGMAGVLSRRKHGQPGLFMSF